MPQIIIGRKKEQAALNNMLHTNQASFLALYGRRRVGKTFLIRQYFEQYIVFDISGSKDGTKTQQLSNFFNEYCTRSGRTTEPARPQSWSEAFTYLAAYLKELPDTGAKQVVFIDEMPWLDTPKSGFVSALEFFWNQHGSRQDKLLLIACGSASSWIRQHLIQARGGLYNRVTHRMRLQPFNLHETTLFLESMHVQLPHYQVLELYMAMGGIPFYLKEAERGKSATQLISQICFSPQGLLTDEYHQLYNSLFKHAEYHIRIVEALAARPQGMTRTDIASSTHLSEGSLSRAIDELVACDFISLLQPLFNKKKDTLYKLTDLYSLFYLKFIKPNKGANYRIWEQLSTQSTYAAWSGYAFETICMMHLAQIKKALGISGVFTNHNSWKFTGNDALPGAQIDLIIDRADRIIQLCEAKFTKENFVLTNQYAAQLRLKKAVFRQVTETKKAVFTTLLTTYPAIQNKYYTAEIENEITMEHLFDTAE